MDESTREDLVEIRREIVEARKALSVRTSEFPYSCCFESSTFVNVMLGFKLVRGRFIVRGKRIKHYWNETPGDEIVDLTASQFFAELPEVFILPRDSDRARTYYDHSYVRDLSI